MTVYTTTVTATNSVDNTLTVATAANMTIGVPIVFSGVVFGGITAGATYYILSTNGVDRITLSGLPGGAVFVVTTGTGTMTATWNSSGQQIIPTVPPGESLNAAFNSVNINFDQVFAAGPVLSNIAIADNTIRTLNTNGNLSLVPNGIGSVVANASIIPNTANIRNLGSSTNRWATTYTQYINVSGGANINGGTISTTGNVTAGNLIANTNFYIGNTLFTRTLTVGTATAPVTVPLASNNSFNVLTGSGNVTVYTT
jgi:hypothetical protein